MNVNIAYTQLSNPNFKTHFINIVNKLKFPIKNICLEITERCCQLDRLFPCRKIEELRNLGTEIAIDDFGTGTLSLLNDLSVDLIKIDSSFIIDILSNNKYQSIIKAITECVKNLKIKVCCEVLMI